MAINLPFLGIGLTIGGIATFVAPAFGPAVQIVAQTVPAATSSNGVWFGVGAAVASVITAIGTTMVQPWFKERGTTEKLTISMRQTDSLNARVDALEATVADLKATIKLKDATIEGLVKQNVATTEVNARLADRLFRTSGALLTAIGKIKPLTEALRPVAIDQASPRHRVLLLEDDDDARVAMAGTLDLLGFDVVAVETVTDARDAMSDKPFDAAVLDLMVSDGDGAEILRIIRQRGLSTRAVVTTGRSEESLGPVYALKPDYLFRKPVDIADVVSAIKGDAAIPAGTPTLAILSVAASTVVPTVKPDAPAKP